MSKKLFERLLFTGCAPRTLLDVGAHVGTFSKMVREVLPTCVPKIPLLDFLTFDHEAAWAKAPERFQFQLFWRGGIEFSVLNGDYLGPNKDAVLEMYTNFFGRP